MGDRQTRYRLLFESSLDAILLADPEGTIYAANSAACRLLGRSEQEIVAEGCAGISGTGDNALLKAVRESARSGAFRGECAIRRKDGIEITVEVSSVVSADDRGTTQASIILRELDERRRSEETLRQKEALLEAFFAASPGVLNILDAELRYIRTDSVTSTYFGLDREELAGKSVADLAPELAREYGPLLRRVVETGRPEANLEVQTAIPATGDTVHWRVSFFPIPLPGDARGVGVVGVDITDLKRVEQNLRESEEKSRRSEEQLRLLFETMQQGVVFLDADGRVLSMNPAAERILGETAAACIGRRPPVTGSKIIRPDGSPFPTDEQPWASALDTGRELRNVLKGVYSGPQDEYRWIEMSAVPLFRPGEAKPYQVYNLFDDITDRKRAEEALRESEARLRLAVGATGIGTFDFYPQTGKLVWSDITKSHFGIAPETEIDHDTFLGAVHPEDRERIRQTGLALAAPGSDGHLATEYRTIGVEDGKERWIVSQGRMLFDAEGRATRLIGTTLDISERKRLEEQLRQRAEELQKVMDVAPVALLVAHDPECKEIAGNPAARALFEGPEDGNLSLTPSGQAFPRWRFFRDGVEIPATDLPMQVAARGIEVRDYELEALLPSGTRRYISCYTSPLRDAAGEERGAVGAMQDITVSKQRTEAALRESEERFRDTADAAPVIMWYGDPQKRVTFFNKQIAVFTGLPAEQMTGDGWEQVIHPDDLEAVRAVYFESVAKRSSYQIEYRARRADGEYRHMLGTTSPRYIGGVYAGQVGTILDITELKRRQEELLARQKLESLGTLAGGIAHDFNNLLGGILSQTELAQAELAEGVSPGAELKSIHGVAIRGAEIVRQLMVYAGQESDTLELVDVSRLVEETVELLKVVVSKHATVQLRLSTDAPAVRANPAALRQILADLVTNASEAMGDRDVVIHVTTARITLGPDSPRAPGLAAGDYLLLEVSDTGRGMSPETQAKVFDPFFTTKSRGRGLGLPVVHRIVTRLGGEITVRSRLRHGTTFRILLPGAEDSAAQLRNRDATVDETGGAARGTVLMVEDEETLRIAVSTMLRKEGFTVLEATDGMAAVELLRRNKNTVTAMFLDVTLPGIASPEILRESRRLRPDLRVILASAYGEEKVAAMFSGQGFQPFLRKPYRMEDVLKLLG